ncbi:MAG: LysR family transcriptional regulator [Victivallaceae bacterium]|nr:LysR family transcriptional regulator [Victivallaceae bacterium]
MEIQRLKYFLRLSETLHFSQTAAEFGMAQSVLSNHIKILEREFDCKLFDRSNRWKVSLTPAGRELAEQTKNLLRAEQGALEKVKAASRGETGILNVGFNPSALNLVQLLHTFHEISCRYPAIQLRLDELPSETIYELVGNDQLDVGFLRIYPGRDEELACHQIAAEPIAAVLPPNHPLHNRRSIRLAELKNDFFLLVERRKSHALRDAIDAACEKAGFIAKIRAELTSLMTVLHLLDDLNAVSIVPAAFQKRFPELVFLPLEDCDVTLPESIIWKTGNSSAVLKTFLKTFKNVSGIKSL